MKTLLCCLLVCGFALAGAPTAAAKPGGDPGQRAKEAFNEGRYDDALRWLEVVYEKDPSAGVVYNMGRVREAAGRLRDAYETYLRVLALPDVDEDMRRLAEAQAEQLKLLKDKAVVKLSGVPKGVIVQVDGRAVTDMEADLIMDPGEHQACTTSADQAAVRCARRRFEAGLRASWEQGKASGPTGTIVWTPAERVEALELSGHPLLVDLGRLEEVVLAVGQHEVKVLTKKGAEEHRLVVTPGARLSLPGPAPEALPAGVEAGVGAAAGGVGEGPGPWPWVVSGAGAAAAAGGLFLIVSAASDKDRVDGVGTNDKGHVDELTQAEANDIWEDARSKEKLGWVFVGAGVAAAAGGIVWWALAPRGGEPASAGGFPRVLAGPSGVVLTGRF